MARSAILAIKIISDATKASREMDRLGGSTSKLEKAQRRATGVAKGAGLGIVALGGAAIKQASDVQQAAGAVDAVFGKSSGKVHALARDAASSVGLARSEYSNLAATLGSQLGNMGVAQDQIVGKTDTLIKRGGDLAATFGGTTSEAVSALGALLRGEADPIERYGVSIKDADIKAQLAAKGQDKLTGAQAKAARTQAILTLLNKQTAKAQGQRAREANSEAQQREVAMAKLKNAGADLGTILLPIVSAIASRLGTMAAFIGKNATAFQILGGVVAGLAVAVYAVNGAIAAYTAVSKIARLAVIVFRNAQLALNLAMIANPVGVIIAAIVILIGLVVLAYKKSDTFRKIVDGAMRGAGKAVGALVEWFKDAWGWLKAKLPAAVGVAKRVAVAAFRAWSAPIRFVIGVVRGLIGWVKDRIPGALRTARAVAGTAFRAMSAPIRFVIGVVRDLIGWVRDRIPGALRTMRAGASRAWDAFTRPIRTAIGWVQDLIRAISRIKIPSLGGIGRAASKLNPFGFAGRMSAPVAAPLGLRSTATTARSLVAPQARAMPLAGGSLARSLGAKNNAGTTIILNGVIDSASAAREIKKILRADTVRIGR